MFTVTNPPGALPSSGITFAVQIVQPGEHYGRGDAVVNRYREPLVVFYDTRFTEKFGPRGQMVTSYLLSTLAGRLDSIDIASGLDVHPTGLLLDGGIPAWQIHPDTMTEVMEGIWNEVAA